MRWLPGLLVLASACAPESRPGPPAFEGIHAALPTGAAGIDPSGLVAAWDLSTVGADGRLVDFGPHGLHGRIEAAGAARTSPLGGARDFSSVEARVHIPEAPVLDMDGPLTLATWLRVDRGGEHQHIVACDDKWALWITPDDRYRLGDTRGGGVSTEPGEVTTGQWTSVVAVLDGTAGSELGPETVRIWVDGAPADADMHMRTDDARDRSAWSPGDLYSSDACYIGFESHQGNEAHQSMPFHGAVDELLIFDRAWTDEEVAAFSARAVVPDAPYDPNGS